MNTNRIEEIQKETAYPDSVSVQQALLKVWNECREVKEPEPEMVELEGGGWGKGNVSDSSCYGASKGNVRATQELAERSAKRMVRSNKLEALAMQIDPEFEGYINGEDNYYIQKYEGKWKIGRCLTVWNPEIVYMSKETAKTICDLLNSKRFVL